jgi:hypothetical protein
MTTLFISDLHLDDWRPETTALLLRFLTEEATGAEALYILGDLFEFWLGDDVPSQCSVELAAALASLGKHGVPPISSMATVIFYCAKAMQTWQTWYFCPKSTSSIFTVSGCY